MLLLAKKRVLKMPVNCTKIAGLLCKCYEYIFLLTKEVLPKVPVKCT